MAYPLWHLSIVILHDCLYSSSATIVPFSQPVVPKVCSRVHIQCVSPLSICASRKLQVLPPTPRTKDPSRMRAMPPAPFTRESAAVLTECRVALASARAEKEKPAAGETDYWRDFWRKRWDSNPRTLADQLISSQSRYDHFDTLPCMFTLQNEGNNRYSFFQKTRATTIPARLVTACFAALSVTIILYHIRRGFARLFPQNLARIFPPRRTRVWFRGGLSAVF